MNSLVGKREAAFREALKHLRTNPPGSSHKMNALDDAYEKAFQRIQQQKGDTPSEAKTIFGWIVNAKRVLRVAELQRYLAVDVERSTVDPKDMLTSGDMIRICAPLVVYNTRSKTIRLVHYTTHEYFKRKQSIWINKAHIDIVLRIHSYLMIPKFRRDELRGTRWDRGEYAALYWDLHAQDAMAQGMDNRILTQCLEWRKFLEATLPSGEHTIIAKALGLNVSEVALGLLLNREDLPTKDQGGYHKYLSRLAAKKGTLPVVEDLINEKVNIECQNSGGRTPLRLAASLGLFEVVKLLLERGAHPIGPCKKCMEDEHHDGAHQPKSPLQEASRNGHKEVASLLLSYEEKVSVRSPEGT
jgi:hypothetical protein